MGKVLHIQLEDDDWLPTEAEIKHLLGTSNLKLQQIVDDYTKFDSSDNKRTKNNPTGTDAYTGPDDVSLNYRQLTDEEKRLMGEVKIKAQEFINSIRKLKQSGDPTFDSANEDHPDIDFAIRQAQIASMWAIRFLTASSYK